MAKGILERLSEGVMLGDGGYLVELEKRGYVRAGPFTPEVVIEHPNAVRELHFEFLRAGAEVLQAFAFYGSRNKLSRIGYAHRTQELNRKAVQLAREVAGSKALVAGNLSRTWLYQEGDRDSYERVRKDFQEQLSAQVEEGIDFVICEFMFHLEEALIALETAKKTGLPVMVTLTFEDKLLTKDGHTPAQCARKLVAEGADVVGTNCGRGPKGILPVIRQMRKAVTGYVAVQPAGYRTGRRYPFWLGFPGFPDALELHQTTRFSMAECARICKDMGVNYIGGCCGTVSTHIREMGRAIGKELPAQPDWEPDYKRPVSFVEAFKKPPRLRK